MPRDFAIVKSSFWTGETGRKLRAAGGDAQRVAMYLITCGSSNMIGLYYLPLPVMCHEIGITLQGASKALRCPKRKQQRNSPMTESPLKQDGQYRLVVVYQGNPAETLQVTVSGAQVVIDQFITSGEAKWGRACGLVMLLPHGYEGQGPEHSSARLERFMNQCAEMNIEVCVPTSAAQVFHMLRRQAVRMQRKPLVVRSCQQRPVRRWLILPLCLLNSLVVLQQNSLA
jgi:hypothetical protein